MYIKSDKKTTSNLILDNLNQLGLLRFQVQRGAQNKTNHCEICSVIPYHKTVVYLTCRHFLAGIQFQPFILANL